MVNYEFMRAESIMNGCPGAKVRTGECILDNMLTEPRPGLRGPGGQKHRFGSREKTRRGGTGCTVV